MYQLLLVEDEKSIAQGIAKGVPWSDWGFAIAGICGNGAEAVDFLRDHKVDLVLSDIRMPKMDGIALMQYLNENYPDIKIIILSGYNDFEYLQMSIRNRVVEYLLKPTDVDEFQELFGRMKQMLDKEAKERREQVALHREQLGNALLRGYGYDEEETERELFRGDTCRYGVVLFSIESRDKNSAGDKALWYRKKLDVVSILTDTASKLTHTGKEQYTPDEQINSYIESEYWCNYEEEIVGLLYMGEEQDESYSYKTSRKERNDGTHNLRQRNRNVQRTLSKSTQPESP